jgi:hypothetical protein
MGAFCLLLFGHAISSNPTNPKIGSITIGVLVIAVGLLNLYEFMQGKFVLRSFSIFRLKNPNTFWCYHSMVQLFVVFVLTLPWADPWLEKLRK